MSPETPPLVSVIMPAYNAARYIGKSIASVLRQTYPRIELIVIDDGSDDGTMDVIRQHGQSVRCLTQGRQGAAAARNAGIRAAAGELVAITVAGAYGAVMASTYNSRPLAPEVMVRDRAFSVVRSRPSYDEMIASDRLAPWQIHRT